MVGHLGNGWWWEGGAGMKVLAGMELMQEQCEIDGCICSSAGAECPWAKMLNCGPA